MENFKNQGDFIRKPVAERNSRLTLAPPAVAPNAPGEEQSPVFDFQNLFRILRRRVRVILFTVFVCAAITVFYDRMVPNTYIANSRILLDEENVSPFGNQNVFTGLQLSNPVVESQMQVIRSPLLLANVVRELDLLNDPEFMNPKSTPLAESIRAIRESIFPPAEEVVEVNEAMQFQAAVERLRGNLGVARNAETLVIGLNYTSTSPQLSARVVNGVADAYINDRLKSRQKTADRAARWFNERMAELNTRAEKTEQQMQRLLGSGNTAVDATNSESEVLTARSELQDALADRARARSQLLSFQALSVNNLEQIQVPYSVGSDIALLAEQAEVARQQLAEATQQFQANPEEVAQLTSSLRLLEAEITSFLGELVSKAEDDLSAAQLAVKDAESALQSAGSMRDESMGNSIEVELRSLEAEARTFRQLEERYLERYLSTIQQQSFPTSEATIIQVATVPEFPNGLGLKNLGMIAIMIGMSLGAGIAFILEAGDKTIRTTRQLTNSTKSQLLGLLPSSLSDEERWEASGAPSKPPKIIQGKRSSNGSDEIIALPENRVALIKDTPLFYASISHPLSTYSETIRRLNVEADHARALLSHYNQAPPKIVAFISDQDSSGRSTAAMNYAEMLAMSGGRTLLIDLDWTGTFLTNRITPAAKAGLADLMSSRTEFVANQAFWYDERTSLYFLPNRSMHNNATVDPGTFNHTPLIQMLNAMAGEFDQIVVDLSPLSHSSDAAALAELVFGYVVVVDWGVTDRASLSKELQRAAIKPPRLLGALFNGVSQSELAKYETASA
ncbi:MAG: exopolysaccharide transport family protein [Pseudomonadota bacterium]